jgi:hypothetical protein
VAKRNNTNGVPSETVFGPRVQFNWGFHDATLDNVAGRERMVSDTVSPQTVAPSQGFYFNGYRAGVEWMRTHAERPNTSTAAWVAFRDAHPAPSELRAEIERCAIHELAHCLRKRRDDPYIIAQARKDAAQSWEGSPNRERCPIYSPRLPCATAAILFSDSA